MIGRTWTIILVLLLFISNFSIVHCEPKRPKRDTKKEQAKKEQKKKPGRGKPQKKDDDERDDGKDDDEEDDDEKPPKAPLEHPNIYVLPPVTQAQPEAYENDQTLPTGIAFPGAEGPGANSKGGRGGKILYVTTTEDTGQEGSFRWAVGQNFPRVVKFKVGGLFPLNENIKIITPYLTIDGSDAPEPVTFKDGTISMNTNDVIIRYIRVRPGDEVALKKGKWATATRVSTPHDGMTIQKASNVIIDHCSVSWSSDEVLSAANQVSNVTVQWCFLYEPLANPQLHIEEGEAIAHAKGALENGENVAYIKNLIACFKDRGPQMGSGKVSAINNLVCFYEKSGTRITPDVGDTMQAVVMNNVYANRLYEDAPDIHLVAPKDAALPSGPQFSIYIAGNLGPLRPKSDMDEWAGVNVIGWPPETLKAWRAATPPLQITPLQLIPTEKVFNEILNNGGAKLPHRDKHDIRIVSAIKAGQGKVILSQDDVGGY